MINSSRHDLGKKIWNSKKTKFSEIDYLESKKVAKKKVFSNQKFSIWTKKFVLIVIEKFLLVGKWDCAKMVLAEE